MNHMWVLSTKKHSFNVKAQDLKLVKAEPRLQTKLFHLEVAAHLVSYTIDLFSLQQRKSSKRRVEDTQREWSWGGYLETYKRDIKIEKRNSWIFRFFNRLVTRIVLDSTSWQPDFMLVGNVDFQLHQTETMCSPVLISGKGGSRWRPPSSYLHVWEVANATNAGQPFPGLCKHSLSGVNRLDLFPFCAELKIKLPDSLRQPHGQLPAIY